MASTVFPAAGGGVTQKVQEFTSTGTSYFIKLKFL